MTSFLPWCDDYRDVSASVVSHLLRQLNRLTGRLAPGPGQHQLVLAGELADLSKGKSPAENFLFYFNGFGPFGPLLYLCLTNERTSK